jgi:hypothetical protein
MWTSVIAGSAFETAGTFDMKLIAKDVVQPEALYMDAETDLRLVIERKSISFPIDYA